MAPRPCREGFAEAPLKLDVPAQGNCLSVAQADESGAHVLVDDFCHPPDWHTIAASDAGEHFIVRDAAAAPRDLLELHGRDRFELHGTRTMRTRIRRAATQLEATMAVKVQRG